jgi:hypothetical protein
MAVADIILLLGVNPMYRSRMVHIETTGPVPPRYGTLKIPLNDTLESYINQHRISLYSHQCEAINRIRSGKNVIITTPTASGKTLAFNLPVFEGLEGNSEARALYLYPTKALSNDQLATLEQMAQFTGISARPAIYDGDTPQSRRAAVRENSRIVISNPHELHQVLAWHAKWRPFFSHLKFIVKMRRTGTGVSLDPISLYYSGGWCACAIFMAQRRSLFSRPQRWQIRWSLQVSSRDCRLSLWMRMDLPMEGNILSSTTRFTMVSVNAPRTRRQKIFLCPV